MESHLQFSNPDPRRILVRGTNWLGDAVMTTPALLRLREKFPAAHIALLGPEKLKDLWLHHPAVDQTISFAPGENVFSIGKKLRVGKFDLALVLPNSPRSALEIFLAGIPQRLGYARPWRNFFLTRAVAPRAGAVKMQKRSEAQIRQFISQKPEAGSQKPQISKSAHQIFEYLNLVAALGANPEPIAPQLFVTPEEIEFVRKEFRLEDTNYKHPFFGINAGAEYGPAKRWPVEKFISAALEIRQRVCCNWVIFGGNADKKIAGQIEQGIDSAVWNLAGNTSLRELMAALKLCRVLLTNDTGPMHVAAALGTPVVVPFGSTSPELSGPGLPGDARNHLLKSDVPCSPCFLRECPIDFRCMNGIVVGQVVEAVLKTV
jgi:heptosyltransferase-2